MSNREQHIEQVVFETLAGGSSESECLMRNGRTAAALRGQARLIASKVEKMLRAQGRKPAKELCPHKEQPEDCEACFRESDQQFDAHREGRIFRR